MAEVPIAATALAALDEATALADSGAPIRRSVIRDWMRSPIPELRALAFYLLWKGSGQVERPPDDEVYSFFLELLGGAVKDDAQNEFRIGRHDAAEYMRVWFWSLWPHRDTRPDQVRRIAELMRDLCLRDNAAIRETILLVVLEHLFCDTSIASYFETVFTHPSLRELHAEAARLAKEWNAYKKLDSGARDVRGE